MLLLQMYFILVFIIRYVCEYLIVGIDKKTMTFEETENDSENNFMVTFHSNTSLKSLYTKLLAP